MASLKELDETLPAYFTMSNKRLIIIARVSEETIYFYDSLDRNTTIILLSEPDCYAIKYMFLELMADLGVTVVDLQERETFDPSYTLSLKSIKIISTLIKDNTYEQIITHPKYNRINDPQNRALYDLVIQLLRENRLNNHYTYNMLKCISSNKLPCKAKITVFDLYCRLGNKNNKLDEKQFLAYVNTSAKIDGLRRI